MGLPFQLRPATRRTPRRASASLDINCLRSRAILDLNQAFEIAAVRRYRSLELLREAVMHPHGSLRQRTALLPITTCA
jgi:hypothetical protein